MLKKLYKHEFYALFRNLIPIYAAVLGFAGLSRLSLAVDIENRIFSILRGFSIGFYIFAIIAVFVVGMVIVVMRFYKNLLSHEGYLTFTLPFTPTQHILCKLVCGAVTTIFNFVVVLASLLILCSGTNALQEIWMVLKTGLTELTSYYAAGDLVLVAVEIVVMILISIFQSLLMFYAAISIGQQFKNKVGGAVVSYIGLYAVVQILSTIILSFSLIGFSSSVDEINNMVNISITAMQIFFLVCIVYYAVLGVVYFFLSRHFLTKKLNLE